MKHSSSADFSGFKMNGVPIGQRFLQIFNLLVSSAKIHRDNNKVLIFSVKQFVAIIKQLTLEEEDATLFYMEGGFYLQEEKITFRKNAASFANAMLQYFKHRKLDGLRFYETIQDAPLTEVTLFARLMNESLSQKEPVEWLEKKFDQHKFTWVEITKVSQVTVTVDQKSGGAGSSGLPDKTSSAKAGAGKKKRPEKKPEKNGSDSLHGAEKTRDKKRKNAVRTYGYAVLSLKDIAHKIGANKKVSIKKTMRLVQNMIDMVVEDNQVFMSLSTIRDYDDYTFTHSINVAIISMNLGHKIGLSKPSLETLSLCALFHDLGKIDVPLNILNKPGKLTEPEFQIIQKHSLDSVRRIIRLKTSRKKKVSMLLPPFEHHLRYDLSGYPKTPRKKPISLFGRIITIADVFDAITAPRVYRTEAISPDRALGYMLEKSGKDFDPLLLKIFINMIGVYPIGTLLRFEEEKLGLVARYEDNGDSGKELWVQLLKPVSDGAFARGELINLGILDTKSGTFNRPIIETLHPSTYGIQPAEYIM